MRKTLLTTVAAAALIVSAGMASAQNAQPSAEPKGGAQMKSDSPPAARDSGAMDKAAPDKAAPKSNAQAKPDADIKAKGAAETKDMNAPAKGSAQSKPDADTKAKSAAETKDSAPARTNAQTAPNNSNNDKSATDSKSTTDSKSATDSKSSTSSKTSVSLSTEQRTKIRTTVLQQSNAPRVSKVDFQISVGTKVPRTVRHAVLPATVVEVYPQWRGFLYFIVGDEIVVVEPDTLEIVAVLQA